LSFLGKSMVLAAGCLHFTIQMIDVAGGSRIATLEGSEYSPVARVAATKDGKVLASADVNGKVKLWDISSKEEFVSFRVHEASPSGLALTPDGNILLTANSGDDLVDRQADGEVKLWKTGK